ncbi:hypothetical protein [Amycolatopsis sp. NPDC059657]|uniref:hypothetical protein n=1 Tax=Amycolatopsis sp. NPDC059657 TaxID=3346899 RepID=UPI0036705F08
MGGLAAGTEDADRDDADQPVRVGRQGGQPGQPGRIGHDRVRVLAERLARLGVRLRAFWLDRFEVDQPGDQRIPNGRVRIPMFVHDFQYARPHQRNSPTRSAREWHSSGPARSGR